MLLGNNIFRVRNWVSIFVYIIVNIPVSHRTQNQSVNINMNGRGFTGLALCRLLKPHSRNKLLGLHESLTCKTEICMRAAFRTPSPASVLLFEKTIRTTLYPLDQNWSNCRLGCGRLPKHNYCWLVKLLAFNENIWFKSNYCFEVCFGIWIY